MALAGIYCWIPPRFGVVAAAFELRGELRRPPPWPVGRGKRIRRRCYN